MTHFRRTKGITKKVLGVDEHLGRVAWSLPKYDVSGEFHVLCTQLGDKLFSGRVEGSLELVFEEFDAGSVDSVIRLIGEAASIAIRTQELDEPAEPLDTESKRVSANGSVAR